MESSSSGSHLGVDFLITGRVQVSAGQSRTVWRVPVGPEDANGRSLGPGYGEGVQVLPDHFTRGCDLEDASRSAFGD